MKKVFFKKISSFILSVMILSVSAGNAFIMTQNIAVTHAILPAVIGYDIMYDLCYYIGSVSLGYSCSREMPEVNIHNDDVARFGYNAIVTMNDYGFFDPGGSANGWQQNTAVLGAVVEGGQYVFGTEAFKQVAESSFTVIQGGKNDGDGDGDDDDDDDENDNIIHFPKQAGDTAKKWFALTAAGAAGIATFISSEYQKWVNGDQDSLLAEFWAEFNDTFSDYDLIQNLDGSYHVMGYGKRGWLSSDTYEKDGVDLIYDDIVKIGIPFAVGDLTNGFDLYVYKSSNDYQSLIIKYDMYRNGTLWSKNATASSIGYSWWISFGVNIPVFSTREAAFAAFASNDFSSALNYAKTYRVADWLADDEYWNQQNLIDPLTGLNALSSWYNIARHQGLNALGLDPAADDLAEYIRDYFAQLGTDILPEVDPALAPVKFPATVEDVVFDPASNPAVYPASDPGTGTNPDPGTGGDTDPGTNPGGDSGSGSDTDVDMDENDYRVELRTFFPFCIPFDFIALLDVLDADPVAPRFEFPVVIPALDYKETVTLDMSIFDDVAEVARLCEKVGFIIFLMFATSKVIRW